MDEETWTVKRILNWIEGFLAQHGDESPRASAQWLVSEAIGVSRMQLFLDSERPLSLDERAKLRDWTRRRGAGEPLQYITGEAAFRHITVKVRPGVLIPRPETEVLVSEALALLPAAPKPQDAYDEAIARRYLELVESGQRPSYAGDEVPGEAGASMALLRAEVHPSGPVPSPDAISGNGRHEEGRLSGGMFGDARLDSALRVGAGSLLAADICTGTGCIACSLAGEHAGVRVVATDLSPEAVSLARENVELLGLGDRVEVLECDLGSGIDGALMGSFDLVVSNPPYVPTAVLRDIPLEVVDFEPTLALDGGEDGLHVYRRLLAWCGDALKPGGAFAFELHETCLDEAADLARLSGYADVRIVADLVGRPRVLTARKPG